MRVRQESGGAAAMTEDTMTTDQLDKPAANRTPGVLGAHSLDHFAFSVPDLAEAKFFYTEFGLDVRETGEGLELYTFNHSHRWGLVRKSDKKRLDYISFGVFEDDM